VNAEDLTPRQAQIVDCARRLLEAEGATALTMGRLAAELGIKAPSLYKHFPGKEELLAELVADGLREQADALELAGPRLLDHARAYRSFALRHPELYRLMTERPLRRDRLPPGLEARAAAPLIRATGSQDLARAAWAFAHGMVELELAGRFPPDADLDAAWEAAIVAFERAAETRC
jgi:AcrR family transcriptional regulator